MLCCVSVSVVDVCMCWFTSLRRNADDLRKSLESVVIPLFCISQLAVDEERQNKLKKVGVLFVDWHLVDSSVLLIW